MKDLSFRQTALGISLLVACAGLGCGPDDNGTAQGSGGNTVANSGSGGKTGSGGVIGSGGVAPSGGTIGSGGTTSRGGSGGTESSGGVASSGGITSSGGTTSSGGITRLGGSIGSGGITSAGGSTSAGGNTSSGGITRSGGTASAGGTTSAGGTASAGGTTSAGGTASSGGATSAGGTTRSGGVTSSGGTTSAGGTTSSGGSSGVGGSTTGGGGTAGLPWLTVVGNKLQDPTGKMVILRGVSIEGLTQQMATGLKVNGLLDKITNKNDVTPASTGAPGSPGWYTKIVRLPADPPGNSDTYVNNTLKPAVDYATKLGLYTIIDLHYIASPYTNVSNVNAFWTKIAPIFKDYSNVFYEVFNESSVMDSWATYKPTMQAWVNLIRGFAPKNIIIAGSPAWDQTMGDAATNPLTGGNIMYSVHMYYQHYNKGVGGNVTQVNNAAKGVPLIMTEWGFCGSCQNQPGTGTNIIGTYGTPMLNWLEGMGGSWTAWCASNSWLPDMFNGPDWTLKTGQDEMGAFVKDWMYTKKDQNSVN